MKEFEENEELEEIDEEQESSGELFEHHRVVVDKGQSLLRIDKFLQHKIANVSRTKIQEAAEANCILVNEKPVKDNYKVKPGDVISVVLSYPPQETEILPEDIPLDILYEDKFLIVVNKKPGMVVHPAHGNYTGTLVNALSFHIKDSPLFKLGEIRPGLIHRIDKDTSGILVIAKTEEAKVHLAKQFFEKTSTRRYQALVWGSMPEKEGTINANLGRSLRDRKIMAVFHDENQGKKAITHYKVLEDFGYVSLIECRLETGRTHQIRVHTKHLGHPIFNDVTYGGDQILKGTTSTKYKQFIQNCFKLCPRQALHAKTLGFIHPISGEYIEFNSELPADMQNLLNKWREYCVHKVLEE